MTGRNGDASVPIVVGPAGEKLPDCHEMKFVERYLAEGFRTQASQIGLPHAGRPFFIIFQLVL